MNAFKVTIGQDKNQEFINVYLEGKRYRFWNGKAIDLDLRSIDNPELLKAAFELKLREGWRPKIKEINVEEPKTVLNVLQKGIEIKIAQGCSERFIKDAKRIVTLWNRFEAQNKIKNLLIKDLQPHHIKDFIIRPNWSPKTQLTIKSTLSPLINNERPDLFSKIKLKKPSSTLHKPFENIVEILEEIKDYNEHLYLCCLMTYGCLLRPHREIRELTWGDFSEDLSLIHLAGDRNKSRRNRIVPIPKYIKELLVKGKPQNNIFSCKPEPYNEEYFKTLWSRFKAKSMLIEEGQTLYSFRHSGAIDIFKRTGSLTKLQKAMGHSSLNVSLTYLRGLEISELKEEDMPKIHI